MPAPGSTGQELGPPGGADVTAHMQAEVATTTRAVLRDAPAVERGVDEPGLLGDHLIGRQTLGCGIEPPRPEAREAGLSEAAAALEGARVATRSRDGHVRRRHERGTRPRARTAPSGEALDGGELPVEADG